MPYKKPTLSYLTQDSPPHKVKALNSPIYQWVPRKAEQVYPFDIPHWLAWIFLGNEDDGIFGEESHLYPLSQAHFADFFHWSVVRNPLHNFTFYIIGQAYIQNPQHILLDLPFEKKKASRQEKKSKTVFNKGLFICLNGFKPFLSLELQKTGSKAYIGWRERGNFGLKLLPFSRAIPKSK